MSDERCCEVCGAQTDGECDWCSGSFCPHHRYRIHVRYFTIGGFPHSVIVADFCACCMDDDAVYITAADATAVTVGAGEGTR